MINGYSGCDHCPLRDCPSVDGHGPYGKLMVIGDMPRTSDVSQNRLFSGRAGNLLDKTFSSLGVDLEDVYFSNAVACRPSNGEAPPREAIALCHQRLLDEIDRVAPEKALVVGATALSSVMTNGTKTASITKYRGLGMSVLVTDSRPVYMVPTWHPSYILQEADAYRDFASDISKWLSNSSPLRQPEIELIIPSTVDEVKSGFQRLAEASVVGCDLETGGFDFLSDEILSIGFGAVYSDDPTNGLSMVISIDIANLAKKEIIRFIKFYVGTLVFHNGKFDMQFLMHWADDDYNLWPKTFADTMLMQCAQDERGSTGQGNGGRGYRTLGLKEQARLRFDIPDYHFDFRKFFKLPVEDRPYDELYKYQGLDTIATARLFFELYDELLDESPLLWDSLCRRLYFPGARALARMEFNGFPIDIPYFQELSAQLHIEVDALVEKLTTAARGWGFETFKPGYAIGVRKVWEFLGFNPPTGAEREVIMLMLKDPKWPKETVEFVNGILEYRQKSKLLSTYVDGALNRVGRDGRLRSDFLLTGADTGRLGSRDPNLQNIPTLVGPIIRRGYIAPEGWTLAEIDYSQLELRIVAYYSRDEAMMKAYQDGRDIHRIVASNMFKKPESEISHLERYMAKYVDFGIIYGRSAPSLANGWEMEYVVENGGTPWTEKEAQTFLDEFLNGFPGLKSWIKRQHQLIQTTHFTETPLGRRRRFPYIDRANLGNVQRQSVNTPVQSLASDVCLFNLITLSEQLPREEIQVISIVHDALYFLIRNDVLRKWLLYCIDTMQTNIPIPIDVPLEVEAKIGVRWGELEKVHS